MILLTGATGAIGSHVARQLAGRSDVRALAHSDRSVAELGAHDFEVVQGDQSDPPAGLFDDVSALFLLTPGSPDQAAQEIGAIDRAVAAGVQRIVKISAREAELGPELFFTAGVRQIEEHLRTAPVAATILRPDHFMSNLLAQAGPLSGGQVIFPGGDGALAWIDPADIAAAAVAALVAAKPVAGTFTLTGPQVLAFDALAAELSAGLEREIAWLDVPNAAWCTALSEAGVPEYNVRLLGDMFASISARPHPTLTDDVVTLTGRVPRSVSQWASEVLAPALQAGAVA